MEATLTFRGVEIRSWKGKPDTPGPKNEIHFAADVSRPIAEQMGWEQNLFIGKDGERLRPGAREVKLKGDHGAENMVLTPSSRTLKNNEIQLDVSLIKDFVASFSEPKQEGGSPEAELRFTVLIGEELQPVIEYAAALKTEKSLLRVRLKADKQGKLPLAGDSGESEDSTDGETDGPALASAREAGVGTHQKKRPSER